MNRNRLVRATTAVLVVVLSYPSNAWGWGKEGHQIVGYIAELHLSESAQAAINQLLGENARISDESVSSWADYVRNQVQATGPWHYVNIPIKPGNYDAQRDCKNSDCVVQRIETFRDVLANKSLRLTERQQALKFLVHLVADLHQPLHCAERVDRNGRPDRGGNDCKVYFLDEPAETNLHRIWDTNLIQRNVGPMTLAKYAAQLNDKITPQQKAAWSGRIAQAWANESNRIAADHVYAGVPADGTTRLDLGYVSRNQRIVDQQLSKAGIRLAKILNEVLGNMPPAPVTPPKNTRR
jgi:hypothetical protein